MTRKFLLVGVMTPALLVGQVAHSFAGAGVIGGLAAGALGGAR